MVVHQINQDYLPAYCRARVLILGVGNILFGDDGFGPAVADYLANHYQSSDEIYIMDVGTGARKLLFTLSLSEYAPDEIVIVDAVDWGRDIGQVVEIPAEALPATKIDDFSLHQVPTSNLLRELQNHNGIKITVVACDVGAIEQIMNPGLSPVIQKAVLTASQSIAQRYALTVLNPQLEGT